MLIRALFTSAALTLTLLALAAGARAQGHDAPKLEVGVQFSTLSVNLPGFRGTENIVGAGGRVTYNLNDYFAVEAEANVYPAGSQSDYVTGGAAQQAQFGAKVGKRWERFGLFAKARPGLISFGSTLNPSLVQTRLSDGTPVSFVSFAPLRRKTHFSADVGGVLEFYPSRRMLVRFDVGDTIIRYGEHDEALSVFPLGPFDVDPIVRAPAETTHNFQFTAGVGFRFGGGAGGDEPPGPRRPASGADARRFEVGVQFSALALRISPQSFGQPTSFFPFDQGSQAEAGFGARVGYNVTDELAFEAEGNFYPRRRYGFNTTVGGYPAQMQAGVKYGRRFERFGIFGKARPGFVTFSSVADVTRYESSIFDGQQFFFPVFEERGKTYFSMDVGGVFEFYPTSRVFTRFDVGDTMIRYPERASPSVSFAAAPPRLPAELRHNLQVTAGIGLRF